MSVLSNSMLLDPGAVGGRPLFIAAENNAVTSTTSITINKPAGATVGDLMIAIIWTVGSGREGLAGWVLEGTNAAGNAGWGLWTRTVDGSEGASFNFAMSGTSTWRNGSILLYRGGVGAVDIIGTETETSSTTVATAASLTAAHAGTLLAAYWSDGNGRTESAAPSGMVQRSLSSGGSARTTAVYDQTAASPTGATSSKTLTWSGATANVAGLQIQIY